MIHYSKIAKAIAGTLLSMLFLNNSSIAQIPDTATQADPQAGSVSLIGGGSTINQRGTIRYTLQNASSAAPGDDGWIPANGVELTISFPNEYGLEPNVVPVIAGYNVVYYATGPGGNIHLRNIQALDAAESLPAEIPVVGFVATASYENTTFNVSPVNPPLICGNTSVNNDNSLASISVAQPLPVRLLNFSAKADACNTILNWSVTKEENFSHYNVAYAQDGVRFTNVGKVAGGKHNYTFSYAQNSGEGFYKIQMVDRDGVFSESKVVKVITDCQTRKILVYPNPAKDLIHVEGAAEGSVIYVMNMIGQTVATRKVNAASVQSIKMEGWAVGNYNVVVVNGSDKQVTTVVKQ